MIKDEPAMSKAQPSDTMQSASFINNLNNFHQINWAQDLIFADVNFNCCSHSQLGDFHSIKLKNV